MKNGLNTKKIQNNKLRDLLVLCTYNLKGLTPKAKIEKCLPIDNEKLSIYEEYNMIVICDKNAKKVEKILAEGNTYSNIELLKPITKCYNINYIGDRIFDLMKIFDKTI